MIEAEEPDEWPTEVAIKVTAMPTTVFESLWSALGELEDVYGDANGEIQAARDWLNYTMQGEERP